MHEKPVRLKKDAKCEQITNLTCLWNSFCFYAALLNRRNGSQIFAQWKCSECAFMFHANSNYFWFVCLKRKSDTIFPFFCWSSYSLLSLIFANCCEYLTNQCWVISSSRALKKWRIGSRTKTNHFLLSLFSPYFFVNSVISLVVHNSGR